jgi:hypothetical protein
LVLLPETPREKGFFYENHPAESGNTSSPVQRYTSPALHYLCVAPNCMMHEEAGTSAQ